MTGFRLWLARWGNVVGFAIVILFCVSLVAVQWIRTRSQPPHVEVMVCRVVDKSAVVKCWNAPEFAHLVARELAR